MAVLLPGGGSIKRLLWRRKETITMRQKVSSRRD